MFDRRDRAALAQLFGAFVGVAVGAVATAALLAFVIGIFWLVLSEVLSWG